MARRNNICPAKPLSKDKFQRLLAQGWGRIWPRIGKASMADLMGLDETKTIDRGLTASNLPAAHTVFNSLIADETALNEILAHYGYIAIPLHKQAANDLSTAAGLLDGASELIRAHDDSVRDHVETLRIADKFRPHMAALNAIISEADSYRGAA